MNKYPLVFKLTKLFGKAIKDKSKRLRKDKTKSLVQQQNLFPTDSKVPILIKQQLQQLEEISQTKHKQISFHAKFNRIQEAYKSMDSSLEGFFYKRTFNLENINFLFQILAEKGDLIEAQALLTKMDQLAISPDNVSYNLLIKTSGKAYNMQTAEHYFSLSVQAFGHDVHIYNSLMYGYARQRNGSMVEKLFQDLKLKGLSPNLPIYTTLINALYKEHSSPSSQGQNILSLQKCHTYYDQIIQGGSFPPDEHLRVLMIEVCASSHQAEKAVSIYTSLLNTGYLRTNLPYDAYIKALASRSDYASQALDTFHLMLAHNVQPSSDTICHTLKACAQLKDIKQANDVLAIMKASDIPPSIYIYTQMAKVYASTNLIPNLPPHIKAIYEEDLWKIIERASQEKTINTHLLDNVVEYYCNDNRIDKVEGLVLPLYKQSSLEVTQFTIEKIVKQLVNTNQPQEAIRLYNRSQAQGLLTTYQTLNQVLLASIKLLDLPLIVNTLKQFHSTKREPYKRILKILSEMNSIPDAIYVELAAFQTQFGHVSDKVQRNQKADKYSHM